MLWSNLNATAYWWTGRVNFGDRLTPYLLERFGGVPVSWDGTDTAHCAVVGSILEHIPFNYRGIIAGAGKLYESSVVSFPDATILGVRGPHSARGVKGDLVLGDPGLLANELVGPEDKYYELGLVPHWSDTKLERRLEFARWNPKIIYPDADPLEVIREIGRCKKIVSSSLHGIIVADAYGIPRRTEIADQFAHEGGVFKFRDYNASIRHPFTVGKTQTPNRFIITNKQSELYDMMEMVGRKLTGKK